MNLPFQIPAWLSLRKVFIFLSAAIFIILPLLSISAGISGDEPVHYKHGEYVYNYFKSDGKDQSAIDTPKTYLKYYGQVVDNFTYLINRSLDSNNPYLTRHIVNSILGALLILFSGLLAVLIAGYRAGILAIIFLFFSPRILGHSFNNLKDIPFALGYIMAVYGLAKALMKYPSFKLWPWVWMAIGLALSFGTRAGGLLLVPIFFFFCSLRWITNQAINDLYLWDTWKKGLLLLVLLLATCLAGFFLGILAWPYALEAPIRNSLESLQVMTNYSVSIRQLYEGEWVWSEHLPGHYPVKYILITSPIIVIVGFCIQFILWKKQNALILSLLNFVILFPLIWVIIKGSNLYGGWRHLLFVYPAIAILSAISFGELFLRFKSLIIRASLAGALIFGLMGPLLHTIRNHPVEYLYFNKFVGGVKGAIDKYESDYYYHSLGPAVRWIEKYLADNESRAQIKVASNFPVDPYFDRNPSISPVYTHYFSRAKIDWDYGIFVNSFLGPDYLNSNNWPPEHTIHSILVDGQVICAIVKRPDKNDFQGIKLYRQGKYSEAIGLLQKALDVEPGNESAQLYLAWSFRQQEQIDLSDSVVITLLKQQPLNDMAIDLLGRNQISKGNFNGAIESFQKLIDQNYKYLPSYEQVSIAADSLGNYKLASRMLERGYQLGLRDSTNLEKLIEYLQKAEYHTKAQKFRTILNKN